MSTDNPVQVVLKFEELINGRNADTIAAFMTADGEFIDSLGNRIQGTEKLRSAWAGYFKMVPDYSISHSEIFADGNSVALFGSAQGTFSKDGRLRTAKLLENASGLARCGEGWSNQQLAGLCRQ